MAEPVLDSPRVVACIGQCVATGVPEHVGVNSEREAGTLAEADVGRRWGPMPR